MKPGMPRGDVALIANAYIGSRTGGLILSGGECSISYMSPSSTPAITRGLRSTAAEQRVRIIASAIDIFARSGFQATPVTEIAASAAVSPAYVFRLFDGKLGLFVAAVDDCYQQVAAAMAAGVDGSPTGDPANRLGAMTAAYVALIRDRRLISLQVQGRC